MTVAMIAFVFEDMLVKSVSSTTSLGLILALFGIGGTVVFAFINWRKGGKIFHPAILCKPMLIRALCEATGRLSFALAITLTPLSSASAILQATPLIVVAGAAFFFDEKIGIKRWLAILVGFIGVLMIIRPGLEGFRIESLFAVIGTLGFAGRDLATRAAPQVLSNIQLGIYGFLVLIPTGLCMLLFSNGAVQFDLANSYKIIFTIAFGTCAYYALTVAMRVGEVSVVTPFRYTRLVFALLVGIFIFAEQPDLMTILGSMLIVFTGGYILVESRKRKKCSTDS